MFKFGNYFTKMRNSLIVSIMLLFSLNCFSQEFQSLDNDQKIIDSLKAFLHTTKSDSLRCILNFQLSNIYGKNKNEKLYKNHLQVANQLIKGNHYLKDISYYYKSINQDLTDTTIKELQVANNKLKKYNSSEIYSLRTKILSNIGLYYQRRNLLVPAIKILTKEAIPLAKKANNNQELSFIYKLIALIFYNNDDYSQAVNYLELSIKTLEEKPINNIGYEEDLIEDYLFYVEVLSVQKEFKKGGYFLTKAKNKLKKNLKPDLFIEYYFAEGSLFHESKEYNNAIIVYEKGIDLARKTKDYYAEIRFNLLKFDALKLQKKYVEAKDIALTVLNNKYLNIDDKVNYSKELSWIYKQLNDYPNALKYSEQFIILNDSLNQIAYKNEIADLEAKFKNKESESKIKQLKTQKDSAELKAQNNRLKYTFFGLTSVVLFFLVVLILLYQKKRNQLALEKNLKNKQQIKILKSQKKLDIIQAMIDGEELERKRIARDLHDGIGSKLSALKIMLSRFENDNSQTDNLEHINQLLGSSINELRQVSYNLVPESLLKLGLENALSDLCHLLHSNSMKIEFQSFGISHDIPISNQINIYRIIQELINNALKHSECSEILVSCSQNENTFYISVEDNGTGFNINEIESKSGLGLKNLKSRIEMLNGTLNLDSNETGTYCNIELKFIN